MQPNSLSLDYSSRGTPRVWFSRIGWAISALFAGNAAATHLILWRGFYGWAYFDIRPWLPHLDEPKLYRVLAVPGVIVAYLLMAIVTRHTRLRAWQWLPPSVLFALVAGGFFGLVWYYPKKWYTAWGWAVYQKALLGGVVVA